MCGKTRVLIAKLGLDAHWRGAIVVAQAMRDAGMEVVYLGNQSPEAIVAAAAQESVDVIGLSTLSGNHVILAPRVVELLGEKGMNDILVILGGTIPREHIATLRNKGVDAVFGPGSSLGNIVDYINERIRLKNRERSKQ
jgi:methylmalonyl-CoA mutase C-terminal domain/subunit